MINDKQLLGKTDSEIKKYSIMKSAFQKIYDGEIALYNKRIASFEMIQEIKEADNFLLNDIYTEFTSQMKEIEEKRKKHLSKIHDKLLPATVYYPNKVKVYKQKIINYVDINKKNVRLENERAKAQSQNEKEKSKALQVEHKQNENILKENSQFIEKDILLFETDRVIDNKFFFLHFIHSELAYHAESFEKLSKLYQKIVSIEPITQLKEFVKKYNLNSVGDLSEYGYDEREFEKKKKNQMIQAPSSSVEKSNVQKSNVQKSKGIKNILDNDEVEYNDI